MKRLRVLFVLPSLRAGGAERIVIRLANHLASRGEPVALAVLDGAGEFRGDLDPSLKLYDLGIARTRYAVLELVRLIRRLKPGLLFSSLTRVSLLLLLVRSLLPPGTRIVVRQPSIASIDLGSIEPRWLYKLLFRRLMPRADLIVSQSAVMSNDLVTVLAGHSAPIVEIPNPAPIVDRDVWLAGGSPFRVAVNFLAVGRLSPEKGYDTLLAAFAIVAAQRGDARLTIIGSGPMDLSLRELARTLLISDKVDFLGYVPSPFAYYVHADALVLASLWEGFPNVLLEAIASGTPVVATTCGGVTAEIVDPGTSGVIVGGEGAPALASGMLAAIGLKDAVGPERIARSIARFSPDRLLAEYERLIGQQLS